MADIWMGDTTYRKAISGNKLKIVGHKALTTDIGSWLSISDFADIAPASEI